MPKDNTENLKSKLDELMIVKKIDKTIYDYVLDNVVQGISITLEDVIDDINNCLSINNREDIIDISKFNLDAGTTTRVDYELPVATHEKFLKDKNLNYALLCTFAKNSKRSCFDMDRYIYRNSIDVKEVCKNLGISESTYKRQFNKLKQLELIEIQNSRNGVIFRLNHTVDNKYFVTLHHEVLRRLVNTKNSNAIKVYLVLKYLLTDVIKDNDGNFIEVTNRRKQITQEFLCEQIGLSKTTRYIMKDILTDLCQMGLIKMYDCTKDINKYSQKLEKTIVLSDVMYYEYELTTIEEFKEAQKVVTKKEG